MSILDKYKTLVLNTDSRPICVVSWKRAICLVMDEKVIQVEFYHNVDARDGKGRAHPIPAVVALRKFVRRDYRKVPFCRKNVLLRDSCVCGYCKGRFSPQQLTLDHVIPRSKWTGKGTPTCWENIVTCCKECNRRKGDKSCENMGMSPYIRPTAPSYGALFVGLNPEGKATPTQWLPYLAHLPLFKSSPNYES